MQIKTTIVNSQISLENIELKFEYSGIYVISGENGTGKTSIIKKIVFEEKNIKFDDENKQQMFNEDRGQIIGYVEQDPIAYDCSLYKYLTRFSKMVDEDKMKNYLKQFDLEYLRLGQNISKLSGGELIKANIIASLLKESSYIFMDEPTNNLDNEGVRRFVSMITEYAKEHTVIIVSHDPRMQFENTTEYTISNNSVVEKKAMAMKKANKSVAKKNIFPLRNIFFDYMFSLSGFASFLYTVLVLFLLTFINNIIYQGTMAVEEEIKQKDIIVGYKVDEQYDELNKIYADSEDIHVDEEKYYQMIYFKDLERLLEDERIEDIVLPDIEYIDRLNEKINEYKNEEAIIDELLLFSVPEQILRNFGGQITLPHNALMLKRGRLPKDGCNEITISERQAEEFFNINEFDAIGREVNVSGREYTVVGIGYSDIAIALQSIE